MAKVYAKVSVLLGAMIFVVFSCHSQVTISSNRVCFGLPSNLQNTSSIPATSLVEWDLDNDGFFDDTSGNNIQYIFPLADTFDVRLRITDSSGREFFSLTTHLVIVDPLPSVSFDVNGFCVGANTVFFNRSFLTDGSNLTYGWDFTNDGVTDASTPNTAFLYSSLGTYNAKLIATSSQNCTASKMKSIIISALPNANFSLPSPCVNSPTLFVNQSSFPGSPAEQFVWSFGDDYLSFSKDSAFHTYAIGDTFFVQLKVIDSSGCADSITKSVIVESTVNYSTSFSNGTEFYQGQSTSAEISGDFVKILWEDSSTSSNRVITAPGYYSYILTNSSGCIVSSGFNINTISPPSKLEQANDFLTPNSDGKNDVLFFKNADAFSDCQLKIFDERGLQVFSTNDYKNEWSGGNCNAGAYYYFLKCKEVPEVKGITNIIR